MSAAQTEFRYRGQSSAGAVVEGSLHAASADAVAARLANIGIKPIRITAAGDSRSFRLGDLGRRLGADKPRTKDLILFCRQMYTVTRTGLPLLRGLNGIMETTHNALLKEALVDVIDELQSGRSLARSLSGHPEIFSEFFVAVVGMGESTGALDTAFEHLCEYLARDQDIRSRVRSAVRYPLIVCVGIVVAVAIITVFVIPNFAPIFRVLGDNIPLPTRIIIGASNLVINHWGALLAVLAIGVASAIAWVRTEPGRYWWHRTILRLPVTGRIVTNAVLARITRSLSVSLEAGLPMNQTLDTIAGTIGNVYMAEKVGRLSNGIERGESLWHTASGADVFSPLILQLIALGEETGSLPELMKEAADHYWRELDYDLEKLSAAIEPILIVVVGAMVLVLALGVFLPMWDMIAATRAGG